MLDIIGAAGDRCRDASAQGIVLCANTPQLLAERFEERVGRQVIHIAEATAKTPAHAGITKALLLGTRVTMEMDFYPTHLNRHGINAVTPAEADRKFIDDTIFGEPGRGDFQPATKARYMEIIESFAAVSFTKEHRRAYVFVPPVHHKKRHAMRHAGSICP